MAKKHVVIAAVAGGVALTIAGGVAVAVALHKNDVVLSVDGETHSVSVREDTVKQVLEKDGITVGEHDVVAPSLDTKITNGMEISVLYGRQLQLTIDGEARTVWTTSRTVDDALTQLNLNDPDSKLSTSRSAAIGREGLSFNISTPKNVTVDAAGTPVELRVAGTVGDALTAAKVTPDEDDVVTPAADTSLTDGMAISYTNVEKRATTKEEAVPFEKKEEKSDELEEGKTKVTTEGVNGVKTQNFVEVYHNGTLVSSELQNEQVTKEPVTQVTKVGTKKASKPSESGSGSGDGSDLGPAKGSSCQASYYWQGQTTASGERFNPNDLTAAHKTLPLGSKVKVTNPSNGKTVVVRINDRGPYVAGRCLDLSKAAMETIGGTSSGVITVNYEVL
ncbi:septal ring lytic transglycosylase RlpA family protein [Arachnia propionica]|uniref:septal ring lytic transglycosylase RlpA family protein n=1 Tax=Arachnia propionica TaxID=1750 RepID=UPI003C702852